MSAPNYRYVVGTGGIGRGVLFQLQGNDTLGRSESRLGTLTDSRDYCKLHIILHYVATFLRGRIPVHAIGMVGADATGWALKQEMRAAGIETDSVLEDNYHPTMYAVCYQYPDGEGGNITTNNSASQSLTPRHIDDFFASFSLSGAGIILAAPEVPLDARLRLLEHGRAAGCCNVAAILSEEAEAFAAAGGIGKTDLLALNEDEAAAFARLQHQSTGSTEETDLCRDCMAYLQRYNPDISVIITRGGQGAAVWSNGRVYQSSSIQVPVVNTAGAGDCLIGTIIAALALGIDLIPPEDAGAARASALDLGVAASSRKVTCRDTIDFTLNADSLAEFAAAHNVVFSQQIQHQFLSNDPTEGDTEQYANNGPAFWNNP